MPYTANMSASFSDKFCVEERRSIIHICLQILWVSMFTCHCFTSHKIQPGYFKTNYESLCDGCMILSYIEWWTVTLKVLYDGCCLLWESFFAQNGSLVGCR